MRIETLAIGLLCLVLCSCSRSSGVKFGVSDDPSWIGQDETRRVGAQFIESRGYSHAQLVEETGGGQVYRFRYATNGTVLPGVVVVDRKSGKAKLESLSHSYAK